MLVHLKWMLIEVVCEIHIMMKTLLLLITINLITNQYGWIT